MALLIIKFVCRSSKFAFIYNKIESKIINSVIFKYVTNNRVLQIIYKFLRLIINNKYYILFKYYIKLISYFYLFSNLIFIVIFILICDINDINIILEEFNNLIYYSFINNFIIYCDEKVDTFKIHDLFLITGLSVALLSLGIFAIYKCTNYCCPTPEIPEDIELSDLPPSSSQFLPVPPSSSQFLPVPPSSSQFLPVPPSSSQFLPVPPSSSQFLPEGGGLIINGPE
uniref:Uncharacterized protein n=1 Tax=Cyclocybe aegerita TaxID=1973307 RepID=A0A884P6I3_CYCAE|nr:hypothetical protein K4014_mgp22 [Cyclocybe aegerita]QQP21454.1 hypothetical protein [Cyclocybe aegerita]